MRATLLCIPMIALLLVSSGAQTIVVRIGPNQQTVTGTFVYDRAQ